MDDDASNWRVRLIRYLGSAAILAGMLALALRRVTVALRISVGAVALAGAEVIAFVLVWVARRV